MMVPRSFVLSAALVVLAAAGEGDTTASPCAPVPTPGPTPAPTLPPRTRWVPDATTIAPKQPYFNVKSVCQLDNGDLKGDGFTFSPRPGAFKPWVVYKLLKANGPFIKTVEKDLMGGQTLKVQNAGVPLQANDFTCVKEGNEWKARVLTTSINKNLLTIKRYTGWCEVLIQAARTNASAPPVPAECWTPVEKCLLQDISLYRSAGANLGLRLDYGNCPIAPPDTRLPGTKKAIIMVGLKRVPDNNEAQSTPNLKGFFQDVCYQKNTAAPAIETQLDLTKAKEPNVGQSCFAATADMEDISALNSGTNQPCFDDAVVYSMLDVNNRFPVLPVMDSDYAWLLSKLPWSAESGADVCDPLVPKQIIGSVQMDRVCIEFEGLQDVTCKNICGKICNSTRPEDTPIDTTTPPLPPAICLDCETNEAIYALLATFLVVLFSYYTYLSNSLSWVATWFFVPLGHQHNEKPPHEVFGSLNGNVAMVQHHHVNKHLFWPATLGLFIITGVWSFLIYNIINLFDTLFCWLWQYEQCVRIWGFQYDFDVAHYLNVNGTASQWQQKHLDMNERGRWIWPHEGPRRMINIDVCPYRMLGMIFTTWFCTWFLMCWWRREQKLPIMKTTIVQEVISEEQGLMTGMPAMGGQASGAGGMLTKALGFFGGGHIPP